MSFRHEIVPKTTNSVFKSCRGPKKLTLLFFVVENQTLLFFWLKNLKRQPFGQVTVFCYNGFSRIPGSTHDVPIVVYTKQAAPGLYTYQAYPPFGRKSQEQPWNLSRPDWSSIFQPTLWACKDLQITVGRQRTSQMAARNLRHSACKDTLPCTNCRLRIYVQHSLKIDCRTRFNLRNPGPRPQTPRCGRGRVGQGPSLWPQRRRCHLQQRSRGRRRCCNLGWAKWRLSS